MNYYIIKVCTEYHKVCTKLGTKLLIARFDFARFDYLEILNFSKLNQTLDSPTDF